MLPGLPQGPDNAERPPRPQFRGRAKARRTSASAAHWHLRVRPVHVRSRRPHRGGAHILHPRAADTDLQV